MVDVTVEVTADSDLGGCGNKDKISVIHGEGRGAATCTRCGLETGLPLTGTKFFCQNCRRAGDPHQDGDSCSELNQF